VKDSYNATEFQGLDSAHPWTGEMMPGANIVFERKMVTVSGTPALMTFAWQMMGA
jgi:hypothetical protein